MRDFYLKGNMGRARFSGSSWFSSITGQPVTVIGAGGIGSWAVMFLAKMGMFITLYDDDSYDINNLGGQLINHQSINTNKAIATARQIHFMLGKAENKEHYVTPIETRFDEENGEPSPIMLCCVDNMEARKIAYEKWKSQDDRIIFIDGRMGAEQYELYQATKDKDEYMESWFPQGEAAVLPCAYKATSHIGAAIASAMVQVLINHFNEDADVPKSLAFQGPLMRLEVDYG